MILIIGGAYQGKLTYAMERLGLMEAGVYRCGHDTAMPSGKKIIYGLDQWILAMTKADMDVPEAIERFIQHNAEAAVICDDISCGVVPMDAEMRKWREETGRSLAVLSRHAEEVIRLFCGIATRIK